VFARDVTADRYASVTGHDTCYLVTAETRNVYGICRFW
jgi:hypothetical protein